MKLFTRPGQATMRMRGQGTVVAQNGSVFPLRHLVRASAKSLAGGLPLGEWRGLGPRAGAPATVLRT